MPSKRPSSIESVQNNRTKPWRWIFPLASAKNIGGIEQRARMLALQLLERGQDITFIAPEECATASYVTDEARQLFPGQSRFVTVPGIESRGLTPVALWNARSMLKKTRPTSIYIAFPGKPVFVPLLIAARSCGIRDRVVHHGGPPEFLLTPGEKIGWMRRLFGHRARREWFTQYAAKSATLTLFNTEEDQYAWQRRVGYLCPGKLWWPPVDFQRARYSGGPRPAEWKWNNGEIVFGSIGRLAEVKSYDVLIKAFALLTKRLPKARLVIVGDGPERKSLEQLSYSEGVAKTVHFAGEQLEIGSYLSRMNAFVLSSQKESLGIVIAEAMASGVPVIVTNLPGPCRVVQDGRAGVLFPLGSVTSLCDAMYKVATDSSCKERLIKAGLERSQLFEPKAVAEQFESLVLASRMSTPANQPNVTATATIGDP